MENNKPYNDQEIMNELAVTYLGGVDLVEAAAGAELDIDITDFDPANEIEMLMNGVDAMIPEESPARQANFDE